MDKTNDTDFVSERFFVVEAATEPHIAAELHNETQYRQAQAAAIKQTRHNSKLRYLFYHLEPLALVVMPQALPPVKEKAQVWVDGVWAYVQLANGRQPYGVHLPCKDFKQRLQRWADEHNIELEW